MINFLHNYAPDPILIDFGFVTIHWYGLFMSLAMLSAIFVAMKLADFYNINKEDVIDTAFWVIIGGLVSARIWYVLIDINYYLEKPQDIIKIWQGGIAIHGAIIGGTAILFYLARKHTFDFWKMSSIIVPGLALGQAIARWGNYFNQELFGKPTMLPWGIPIEQGARVFPFTDNEYFHPAFLYESIGNLTIFAGLVLLHYLLIKGKFPERISSHGASIISLAYLAAYSVLRFLMEFIRIDPAIEILGLRLPQLTSLVILLISAYLFINIIRKSPALEKN